MGNSNYFIPENELVVTFARSGGKGGQNVNKTSTKAIVRWSLSKSNVLSWEEKERIRAKLANRINNDDELLVVSEEERSQPQNREKAVARLRSLVAEALRVPKKRRPTRPTRASKLRHMESKIQRSRVKKGRKGEF